MYKEKGQTIVSVVRYKSANSADHNGLSVLIYDPVDKDFATSGLQVLKSAVIMKEFQEVLKNYSGKSGFILCKVYGIPYMSLIPHADNGHVDLMNGSLEELLR
jgi:hypothetical protein